MRIIKLALISFVFFFVLLFLMSLMIPSQVRISKAINITQSDSNVLALVRNEAEWKLWHPAFTEGVPPGQRLIKVSDTSNLIAFDIWGRGPYPVRNSWALHRFGPADSLTVQWYMDFKLSRWPWHKFSSLFYEGTYGQMMETGLNQLKKEVIRRSGA